jgi:hypothetical protein
MICKQCKKVFEVDRGNERYCSENCWKEHRKVYFNERYKKNKELWLEQWKKRYREIPEMRQRELLKNRQRYNKDYWRVYNKERYYKFRIIWLIRAETKNNFKRKEKCEMPFCNNSQELQFHHWIYKRPVEKKHFSTLCRECHLAQHSKRPFEAIKIFGGQDD